MFAIKLPNPITAFFITLIGFMAVLGLLFWAVGAR
jgi:hypothetical protein